MKQKTFAIIGGTLWGNRGAEAMVVTTMGRVRETVPDASFLILSYYPAADRRLAGGAATPVAVDDATPRTLLLMHFPFALLWQITADFEAAYTGKVRFFLRDQTGTWVEGSLTCDVAVR